MPISFTLSITGCSFLERFEPNTQNLLQKGRPFILRRITALVLNMIARLSGTMPCSRRLSGGTDVRLANPFVEDGKARYRKSSVVHQYIRRSECALGACEQQLFRFFERSNCRFTRDGRKPLQKVFERFPAFEVVE